MSTAKTYHHSLEQCALHSPKVRDSLEEFLHNSLMFIFIKENRAENQLLLLRKEGRAGEGTSNTLLGNTKLLLRLHKNEIEHDSDNNCNSHCRS